MSGGGSKPGERRGGRQKGALNKATREKQLIAARTIDTAREQGKELAKEVLERLMQIAEGATGVHRPTTDAQIAAGTAPKGDWGLFGEWFDRTVYCAKELAKYQSPTFRAVVVAPAPEPIARDGSRKRFTLTIYDPVQPPKTIEVAPPLEATG